MKAGKANLIIDGQWGSTGKGKVASYLALTKNIDIAVCCFAPNAGHTHYKQNGDKVILKVLPSSIENPDIKIMLGPASVINVDRLMYEMEEYKVNKNRLFIDRNAIIINERDLLTEEVSLQKISSTLQGTGSARSRKIMRNAQIAEDISVLSEFVYDVPEHLHLALNKGKTILVESPQGFDLSLNFGHRYPFVTSRDITPSALLADLGLLPYQLGDTYGVLRPYPIRVGDAFDKDGKKIGWSGPHYDDQEELSWEIVAKNAGITSPLIEKTTVTNKVRRVFTWSDMQFARFMRYCNPTYLCFNHVDYIDGKNHGQRSFKYLSDKTSSWFVRLMWRWENEDRELLKWSKNKMTKIKLIGTGPRLNDMIDLEESGVSWTLS